MNSFIFHCLTHSTLILLYWYTSWYVGGGSYFFPQLTRELEKISVKFRNAGESETSKYLHTISEMNGRTSLMLLHNESPTL